MDELRSALITIKTWLTWLPDPAVALLIIVTAAGIALVLHKWLRRLIVPLS